jgi:hypothetical protein
MTYDRGEVWWGPAQHKSSPSYRPWVLVSDTGHPFAHTESIALAMTTQPHAEGIEVPDAAWDRGGSQKDAFVSPWYAVTIKHRDLDRQQGSLADPVVAEAVEKLHRYTSTTDG